MIMGVVTMGPELQKSKVFVKIDEQWRIVRCEGGYTMNNIQNIDEWIFIDEGVGDKYNLCQSNYFDRLYTEGGIPRYKWDGERAILRSDGEIEADRAKMPKPPITETELLKAQLKAVVERNDFIEDCIAEMAMQIYQ